MPDADIAALLAASKAAHGRYRSYAGRIGKDGKPSSDPNYAAAEREVRAALEARQAAHDADPDHADPQWAADAKQWPHDALVRFYQNYLVIP